jgi:hypothetical protein
MNRTLLSLAIIRTNWEQSRKDYIENFVPLVATLIKIKGYTEIAFENINEIKKDFQEEYGLVLPSSPLFTILNRLSKKKLIIRDQGKFIPNYETLKEIDISKKSNEIRREHEKVIKSLEKYISEKHNMLIEISELESGLISFLKQHDLDLLFAAEDISLLPQNKFSHKIDFFINEFIAETFRSEPDLFRYILNLTIGHALSSTILYKEFNTYSGKLKNLNIYLDTPFIFNLLGISGVFKKNLAEEIVSNIDNEKANLFILDITKGEIDSNLNDALKLFEKGETNPAKGTLIFKNCLANSISGNDIEKIYIDLPQILEKYNIKLDDVPDYIDFQKYQVNEEKLYETIVDSYEKIRLNHGAENKYNIGFLKHPEDKEKRILNKNNAKSKSGEKEKGKKQKKSIFEDESKINNTIYRDVKVLSGIFRFRKGNSPKTLKDCKYLFITTNSTLAYASRKFEKKEYNINRGIPTCLTDIFLGTLIWLHSPAELININEKKIIADCYAALTPSDRLIAKYLEEVEKLKKAEQITEDNYYLLRTHRSAINILETKSFGDPEEFNAQTVQEILESLIDKLKKEEREKLEQEKLSHSKTQEDLEIERVKLQKANDELVGLKNREESRKENIKKKIHNTSDKKAKKMVKNLVVVMIVLLSVSFLVQATNYWIENLSKVLVFVCWGIIAVSGLFNILVKFNVKDSRQVLYTKTYGYFKNKEIEKYKSFLEINNT